MNDHEHDRFLMVRDDFFIFGCINPFCGHGDPPLPNSHKIPNETKKVTMKLLSHKDRKLEIEVTVKKNSNKTILACDDNLEACRDAFERIIMQENL